eukprot:5588600-Pyramimonas_sp.AAC.1
MPSCDNNGSRLIPPPNLFRSPLPLDTSSAFAQDPRFPLFIDIYSRAPLPQKLSFARDFLAAPCPRHSRSPQSKDFPNHSG